MRKFLLTLAIVISAPFSLFAQNVFPTPTGDVGIGTTNPQATLHTIANYRNYLVNKAISGSTLDNTGLNYILLHQAYNGTSLQDCHTIGTITGIRGNTVAWNRKWTVDVHTASAYQSNTGNIVCRSDAARLVLVTHQSVRYMAVEIPKNSLMAWFSFTGYCNSPTLTLVAESDVTDVTAFTPTAIAIPGTLHATKLFVPDAVAIGGNGTTGTAKLAVEGTIAARKVKVQQTGWPDFVFADGYALQPLDSLASFVRANKHLPGIPSEAEVKKDGLDLGDMNAKLLQKIEELTLYLIDMKAAQAAILKENAAIKQELQALKKSSTKP